MKRILTGDRPTADKFHLGNYIGKLKNTVKLQDEYETYVPLVDLHALSTHFNKTGQLEENMKSLVLDYLSVGIDPDKTTIFIQSQVPEIVEIAYFLSVLTPRSVIARQPALKEKLDSGELDTVGLFYYPILMAADILTFQADLVPVGKDQKAHVEFARDMAIKFNNLYGEVFSIPEPLIGDVPTLPGTDGQAKMGKSLNNAIFLADSAEEVEKKVMSMYTDPTRIRVTDPGHVEGNPVFIYLDAFGSATDKDQIAKYKDQYTKGQVGDIEVKKFLVKILNNFLDPIRQKRAEYTSQPELVEKILKEGTEKARQEAKKTIEEVKRAMKLDYFSSRQHVPITLESSKPQMENEKISVDEFMKSKLKVGTVVHAEAVENSDKLLRLEIDLGEGKPRQILAGIEERYKPKDFVGNQVVVVSNLEPKVMRGLESQGMMLAADSEDGPVFLSVPEKVPPGTKIR